MKSLKSYHIFSSSRNFEDFLNSSVLVLFLFSILLFPSCQPSANKEKDAIKAVMMKQQEAWNNGNIDGFMQGYWKSDSLMFIGSKGLTYGWETTLNNYKKSYPSQAKMGRLQFTIKKIQMITPFEAHMVGKWELFRENDHPEGYFTLLWKKFDGEWKVIADHTS